jgi:integrase
MRTTLTENAVRAAQPGSTLWDGSLKHFGLRVAPGGTKSFLVLLGSGRRQAIGRYPEITLAQARAKAKRILAERTLGRHQASSVGWQTAVEKFLDARRSGGTKDSTVDEYERTLKRYFTFGATRLTDISKRDISGKLDKLNSVPSQKAHALVVIKMFFRWALHDGYVEIDPTASFKRSKQKKRKRVLSDAELKAVWEACDRATDEMPYHFRTIVKLLILWGQRRGETAALRREYFSHNQQTICLPEELTKNGREHLFPIGTHSASILGPMTSRTGYMFPARRKAERPFNGWSKSKAALDKLSGVKDWTLHDLRRTFRTIHARIGTPPHIAERLINHVNGVASDVEQIYDQYRYLDEMRVAMRNYEHFLVSILRLEAQREAA